MCGFRESGLSDKGRALSRRTPAHGVESLAVKSQAAVSPESTIEERSGNGSHHINLLRRSVTPKGNFKPRSGWR